jgi:hypothetical protein
MMLVENGSDVVFLKKEFDHKGPELVFSNAKRTVGIADKKKGMNLLMLI